MLFLMWILVFVMNGLQVLRYGLVILMDRIYPDSKIIQPEQIISYKIY